MDALELVMAAKGTAGVEVLTDNSGQLIIYTGVWQDPNDGSLSKEPPEEE